MFKSGDSMSKPGIEKYKIEVCHPWRNVVMQCLRADICNATDSNLY